MKRAPLPEPPACEFCGACMGCDCGEQLSLTGLKCDHCGAVPLTDAEILPLIAEVRGLYKSRKLVISKHGDDLLAQVQAVLTCRLGKCSEER